MNEMLTHAINFEIHEMPDDAGVFTGYASKFNVLIPGYNEKVLPGAFARTIGRGAAKVPILWNHNPDEVIGFGMTAEEDTAGLLIQGKLDMNVQRAIEARSILRSSVAAGNKFGISIGFYPVKEDKEQGNKGSIRLLKEVELIEYSLTAFPANKGAKIKKVRGYPALGFDRPAPDENDSALELHSFIDRLAHYNKQLRGEI